MAASSFTGHTRVYGVIGWPIEHSLSPAMHNAALAHMGLDACYLPFAVSPERVAEAILGVRALAIAGINVTVPHKQAVLPWMDELTPEAQAIGAVNTVIVREGRLIGHNTDASGLLRAWRSAGVNPQGCRAIILGAGGAARAVAYALATQGASVTVLNRTAERAESLVHDFAPLAQGKMQAAVLDAPTLGRLGEDVQLIVNTTPLGMWPKVEASPWPDGAPFPARAFVTDLIYNPRPTRFLQAAASQGLQGIDGLEMLVYQGAEALERWTQLPAPVEVMRQACLDALANK